MKRLYFLIPSVEAAINIVEELRTAGIPDQDIYVVGKDHHRLQMAHLHEAGILQTTGLLYALKRGALIGGLLGIIVAVLLLVFIPEVFQIGMGIFIALGLFGIALGAWASTLIGTSTPNPRVWKFESDINEGKLLMLIDVPKQRETEIVSLIKIHHPEALVEGYAITPAKQKKR